MWEMLPAISGGSLGRLGRLQQWFAFKTSTGSIPSFKSKYQWITSQLVIGSHLTEVRSGAESK